GRAAAFPRSRDRAAGVGRSGASPGVCRGSGCPDRRRRRVRDVLEGRGDGQRGAARARPRKARRRHRRRRSARGSAGRVAGSGWGRRGLGSESDPGAAARFPGPVPRAVHRTRDGGVDLGPLSLARLDCRAVIYVCVPVRDEARTVGLVLWKVRQVFTAFQREYQLLVCDDASSDGTGEVLTTYAKVLPLTIVTHRERRGYAPSVEELLRLALQRTDRPKRDCAITLHADFVHNPDAMEEMVKRLESGADLVVAEQLELAGEVPWALRWARRWAPRLLRVAGVRDTVSGYLALRLALLRQALRTEEARPLLTTDGWPARAELVARLAPHARRLDTLPARARYDLQQRPSRVQPWREFVAAWKARRVIRAARAVTAAAALLVLGAPPRLTAQSDSTSAAASGTATTTSFPTRGSTARRDAIPRSPRCPIPSTTPPSCIGSAPCPWSRASVTSTGVISGPTATP